MRRPLALMLLASALPGCHCSPSQATPVTLVVKNGSGSAIWVDDSAANLGLAIQQSVGGKFQTFVESPPCACLACDKVCAGCSCNPDPPPAQVLRVDPGMSVQREWSGVVQQSGNGACGGLLQGASCLTPQIPPVDQVFNLHLCYSPSVSGVGLTDAGVAVSGSLPPNPLCVDRQFRVEDGTVEVGPVPGASCTSSSDCKNPGELCFSGECTTACPANTIPPVGGGWQISIPDTDNQGLLTVADAGGQTVESGTGSVTSVRYSGGQMTLTLTGKTDAGSALAIIYVTLPSGFAVPLSVNDAVAVKIIDASTDKNQADRAITLRDGTGALLLAADTAQLVPVLGAADLVPFSVTGTQTVVGCDEDSCGKLLHFSTVFDGGAAPVELQGGQSQTVVAGGRAYVVLNVANNGYPGQTACALQSLMPYAVVYKPGP